MSYRKFALVPYTDYQVMVDHKCTKNESASLPEKHTLTHDTTLHAKPQLHNTSDKSEHAPESSALVDTTKVTTPLTPSTYKDTPQPIKRVIKNKTPIESVRTRKPVNTKRKKVATQPKKKSNLSNFTWLAIYNAKEKR